MNELTGENPLAGEQPSHRRRFGLKSQLLLLLFTLNVVAAGAYSAVLYEVDRTEIIAGIDGRLKTAALAVAEMAPGAYHVRVTGPGSITTDEYDRLQRQLSRFADGAELQYVYTYMRFGREIRTVSTSATPREWQANTRIRFFAHYREAPPKLHQTFADGRPRFDEYKDEFGAFRSIYLPMKAPDGRTYVVGADIPLGTVRERLSDALRTSIAVGVAMFGLSMALGWLLVDRIIGPLIRLTAFTRNIGQRNFQPDETETAALSKISRSRPDEVGSLAEAMTAMIARLQRYLVEMQQATAARERVEGELSAARDIQAGMLPRTFPPFPDRRDVDVFALLESAKQVGGDLYDYALIDRDRLFFVVGDVSGKGVPAALFMAMTTTLFKAAALGALTTGELMARVNAELARDNAAQMFVTAVCGILDLATGDVQYSDGGHEAPFVRRADGRLERLPKLPGMALGIFDDTTFETGRFQLAPGDALVLFTDGVSEAANLDDDLFTVGRIETALAATRPVIDARGLAQGLAEDVRVFVGEAAQSDDIAILVVRYEGPARRGP
ncbi:SpoIIE family protein phosphatase [uncultured Phenylobacterium sp.]|uniref:PP2C family protein-serine/threonine phosphatase n=1 Tax=uncultured Phenylobacterium sp. TaxID=349273 RepID=UPI0025CE10D3|nr:SpoIIE family protein phosphatase [uncultured Phenylobacterium sp.]